MGSDLIRLSALLDDAKCFDLIRQHRVTHFCGAPIVHSTMANAPAALRAGIEHKVKAFVASAAPRRMSPATRPAALRSARAVASGLPPRSGTLTGAGPLLTK